VIAASNKSDDQAYRYLRKHHSFDPWIAQLWRKKYSAEASVKQETESPPCNTTAMTAVSRKDGKNTGSLAVVSVDRIWRLLLIHATRNRSAAELSERFGVHEQRIQQFIDNAKWLSELQLSKNGKTYRHLFRTWTPDKRFPDKSHRIICPTKHLSFDDQKIIAALATKFRTATNQDRALAERVLDSFATKWQPSFSGMIFTDPDEPNDVNEANDFILWLKALGFKKQDIRIVTFDVTAKRSPSAAQWKRALGNRSAERLEKLPPPNGRNDWACRWLGIKPIFPDDNGDRKGNPAFRFLMIMAFIGMKKYVFSEE
jgi:hypothetical protein